MTTFCLKDAQYVTSKHIYIIKPASEQGVLEKQDLVTVTTVTVTI